MYYVHPYYFAIQKTFIILKVIYPPTKRYYHLHYDQSCWRIMTQQKTSYSILIFCCQKYNYNTFQAPLIVFAFNIKKTYLEMRITKKGVHSSSWTSEVCDPKDTSHYIRIIRYNHNYTYERETFQGSTQNIFGWYVRRE